MHRLWIESIAIPVHFIAGEAEKVLPLGFFREKVGIACQCPVAGGVP